MEYENWQQRPEQGPAYQKKKKMPGWAVVSLVVAAALLTGAVLHLLNIPAIRVVRSDYGGITIYVGNADLRAEDLPSEEPDPEALTPSADHQGTGTKLEVAPAAPGTENIPSDAPGALSLQSIYEKAIGSVVTVTTQADGAAGMGTGIIMSEDGYIITNQHVIEDAREIRIRLHDDTEYAAALVGSDAVSDLAVLKIQARGLTTAAFGDSDSLRVGDVAVAIGNPLSTGLRGTMTDGIISGISRDMTVSGRKMTLIQTNAALNSGNSGGPLLNCYGQVVGICTAKLTDSGYAAGVEGLGFAIPIAAAKPIVDELIEKGYVSGRPALGVTVEDVPLRARIYFRLPAGAYVTGVDPDSDAWAGGLRAGDVITGLNGQPVTDVAALSLLKDQYAAGDTVTVTVYRGGRYAEVDIVLMDRVADQ